jgi:hypothetical protein
METFLLGTGQRLLQVGLRDERGSAGAVLTLADEGGQARFFPVRPTSPTRPEAPEEPEPAFPTVPQGLTEGRLEHVDRLVLDTSDLPGRLLLFAVEPFLEQAARHAKGQPGLVRLTLQDAEAWGLIEQTDL